MSARSTRKRARTESEEVSKHEPEPEATSTSTGHADRLSQQHNHHGDIERDTGRPRARRRDPEFWFSDGTVILVAQAVEFRIYRGILAEYSPVLKAMFAAPPEHPSRVVPVGQQQCIACPIIELKDTPEDLRHILRAYLSRKQTRFFEETRPSFHQISAYIRLGEKYKLDELSEQSRQFLKHHYTDDLRAWDKHQTWGPPGWRRSDSIGVVNLARLINEPSLLPTALIACVYMDAAIVQGFEREDGTRETLALDDLARCFKASRDVREAHVTVTMRTFKDTVSPPCSTVSICGRALRATLRKLEARMDWLMSSGPFLKFGDLLQDVPVELAQMCETCAKMVEARHKKEREAFWARLPELLDIEVPGWGVAVPQGKVAS